MITNTNMDILFNQMQNKCPTFSTSLLSTSTDLFWNGKLPYGLDSECKIKEFFVNFLKPHSANFNLEKAILKSNNCKILTFEIPPVTSTSTTENLIFKADLTCRSEGLHDACFEAKMPDGSTAFCRLSKGCWETKPSIPQPTSPTPTSKPEPEVIPPPTKEPEAPTLTTIDNSSYAVLGIGAVITAYLALLGFKKMHKWYNSNDEINEKNHAIENIKSLKAQEISKKGKSI